MVLVMLNVVMVAVNELSVEVSLTVVKEHPPVVMVGNTPAYIVLVKVTMCVMIVCM